MVGTTPAHDVCKIGKKVKLSSLIFFINNANDCYLLFNNTYPTVVNLAQWIKLKGLGAAQNPYYITMPRAFLENISIENIYIYIADNTKVPDIKLVYTNKDNLDAIPKVFTVFANLITTYPAV